MFFDHKTKKFSGKIRDITPEEDAYGRKLVEQGVMESTEHPSDDEIARADDYRNTHKFGENLEQMLKDGGFRE